MYIILYVWGQLIIWLCVGPYMEIWCPQWFKMVKRHTLYLNVGRWSLVRPDTCLFGPQTANTKSKCIGPDLAGKWAVSDLAQLFLSNWWTVFNQFSGVGNASKLSPVKIWANLLLRGPRNKSYTKIEKSKFCRFWFLEPFFEKSNCNNFVNIGR